MTIFTVTVLQNDVHIIKYQIVQSGAIQTQEQAEDYVLKDCKKYALSATFKIIK